MQPGDPAISVVIVAHEHADELPLLLSALGPQLGPADEVILVDNASGDGTVAAAVAVWPSLVVQRNEHNVGFALACNQGAARAHGELLLLLNPDCVPEPGCLDALRACAAQRPDWGAWQALVLLEDGELVNTSGNVVHFLGFGWAGGWGEPASSVPAEPHAVGFGSGAALVVRRRVWEQLGGFEPRYFMYGEDLELGLRLRLLGLASGVCPAARVRHGYEFEKGAYKWFYLERNRWWTILATYPGRLLALVLPGLLVFELALLPAATAGGWLGPKLRAQVAVLRDLPRILARRRVVQRAATCSASDFASGLVASLDSPVLAGAARIPGVSWLLSVYWRAVKALLG